MKFIFKIKLPWLYGTTSTLFLSNRNMQTLIKKQEQGMHLFIKIILMLNLQSTLGQSEIGKQVLNHELFLAKQTLCKLASKLVYSLSFLMYLMIF